MQIYVCIKHVPDSGALIELDGATAFVDGNVKFTVNPFDEYGIEEALKLSAAQGGEVILACYGNKGATSSIRAGLAMGAARAIHVVADGQFTTAATAAQALAKAITDDGSPDLIFTGKQSIDSAGSQFQYHLGKALNMPVINEITSLTLSDGKAAVTREAGGGATQKIALPTPCILGATRGLNEPRYPKLPDIMKSKKKPIQEVDAGSLNVAQAPCPELTQLELVPERSEAKMLEGDIASQAKELMRILREEEKVI